MADLGNRIAASLPDDSDNDKVAETTPWEIVCVDLVGPWSVKTPSGTKKLQAFTAIDPATGWFEMVSILNKSADTVMDTFHNCWLTRYRRHIPVIFDNGSEFKAVFKEMCDEDGCEGTLVMTKENKQFNIGKLFGL
jgi:hypothetical protein